MYGKGGSYVGFFAVSLWLTHMLYAYRIVGGMVFVYTNYMVV